jgi:hypothetical protein
MTKNNINNKILENIEKYLSEPDWKIWINYKEEIKLSSLNMNSKKYNILIDYVYNLKSNYSGENKLKIFELWAMLSNNKIYIEK